MNEILKLFISLSISASIIALAIFALKPIIKDKVSKTWQCYIWLIVIIRLLLPFSIESSIVSKMFEKKIITYETTVIENAPFYNYATNEVYKTKETVVSDNSTSNHINFKFIFSNLLYLSLIISFLIFTKHITSYRSFIRYIKAGRRSIKDEEILDIFFDTAKELNLMKYPNLYCHKLIYSSMAIGIIKPFVVIPESQLENKETLKHVFLHELTHIKRYDTIYKWLVQILVCIHWFNPILYFMKKDINNLCELSCDEQVIKNFDENERTNYGNTLLYSIEISGNYEGEVVYNQLCEDGKLIRERLSSIKKFRKRNKLAVLLSIVITCSLFMGAIVIGAYTGNNSTIVSSSNTTNIKKNNTNNNYKQINEAITKESFTTYENSNDINSLLPFMSSDKVSQLANEYFNKTEDVNDIKSFLPFMNDNAVDEIADKIILKTNDINEIKPLLPFMNDDKIGQLAMDCINKSDDISNIQSALPFMDSDFVDEIADKMMSKTNDINKIKPLLPFMNDDKIGQLATDCVNKFGDISAIQSLLPFMENDYIDAIADKYLSNISSNSYDNTKSDFVHLYAEYEPYGLKVDNDRLLYNGKEVRWFIDKNHSNTFVSNKFNNITDSLVDVETVRKNGKLIGLKQSTQEEYDSRRIDNIPVMNSNDKSSSEKSENDYSLYEDYGIKFDGYNLLYDNQKVRWFMDENGSNTFFSNFPDGLIDVETIRKNGKLIGLRKCTQQEYDSRDNYIDLDKMNSNQSYDTNNFGSITYNLQNMDSPKSNIKKNLFSNYNENNDFIFDEQNKVWKFNDKPLKMFYDDMTSDTITLYYNLNDIALNEGIAIKFSGVINNGKREFVELTEAELKSIYTNKAFRGLGGANSPFNQ